MMTDVGGLALALLAIRLRRARRPQRTYGYLRMEVLSALTNAVVLLLLLTVDILYEAYQRFQAPPEIQSGPGPMLVVAAIGLVVNLISMRLMAGGSSESLNVKGTYFEVLSDMLGSIGVNDVERLGARRSDHRCRNRTVHRTEDVDAAEAGHAHYHGGYAAERRHEFAREEARRNPCVTAVHDLHVWTVTSGFDAMSGHLVVADLSFGREALRQARRVLKDDFGIDHVTVKIDDGATREPRRPCCMSDAEKRGGRDDHDHDHAHRHDDDANHGGAGGTPACRTGMPPTIMITGMTMVALATSMRRRALARPSRSASR